ncbi:hypothetical protein GCM10009547_38180 [Sporichthya brevicatena]|uniref:Galactose oxidase n=1 Tax=Sporichthya brevicatena TaxID=171442 RepID=A0ABN1H6V8_9ACTN
MRKPILAAGAAVLVVPLTPSLGTAAPALTAADTGLFSALFEEPAGKYGTDCVSANDPRPRCKPTANAVSQLADGRQIYWSGLEGMDEPELSVVAEFGHTAINSGARVLDMRSGAPTWKPTAPYDALINANGNPDNEYLPLVPHNNDKTDNDGDLFCADLNFLADGRLLTNGGTAYYEEPGISGTKYGVVELQGLRNTRLFDPRTDRWSEVGKMKYARWYPTMVTQPDGSILTFSGVAKMMKPYYPDRPADSAANERHVERFDPKTGTWTVLPDSANKSLPLYPRMHLLPDGRTFFNSQGQVVNPMGYAWDEATWSLTSVFDPRTNSWTDLGINDFGGLPLGFRGSGFSMMLTLKPGDTTAKFLSVGGVPFAWPGGYFGVPYTTMTEVGPGNSFKSYASGNLHSPRWYNDGVLLPTGHVWVVNGADRDHLAAPGIDIANRTTELWDPATGQWTVTAAQSHGRTYHPTAMLLPDGRVLVGGHAPAGFLYGRPTDAAEQNLGMSRNYADPTFQIFSPPYLYWGKRPVITKVNPNWSTNRTMTVNVDRPSEISSVRLTRNPTVTHLMDGDQRNVELKIVSRSKNSVTVEVPNSNYLPAGPYMLFVHTKSAKGEIPSVSRQVFVDAKLTKAQVKELQTRAAGLVRGELLAGVPEVPAAGDLGSPGPSQGPLKDVADLAVLPGPAVRTESGRRPGRRRSLTLTRRAR